MSRGGLLTLGETLGLVAVDHLRHARTAHVGIGGAESNVAIGVRRLGLPAAWIGRVGDDPWGERVVRDLRAEDVACRVVVDPAAPTGLMTKQTPHAAATTVTYHRAGSAGSRLAPDDVPDDLVAAAGVVHLTGITPGLSATAAAAVDRALALAAAHGVPVSFDVNHRTGVWGERDAAATYRRLAAASAVVFAGPEEARLVTGTTTTDPEALLDELAAGSGGDVVLKLGAEGALARIDGVRHRVPAHTVAVVDTVGAGDAFVAGYLAELLAGSAPAARLEVAARCGALACLAPGDWEAAPTRADLAAFGPTQDAVRR
ncbi:sugar kinase [Nocardioides fonticola]|uniref:Sugar kinase n=1 Tax=Nocardioides fonticola TaxID=450363 RepID=A0ABP7XJD5_9ACTN